MTTPFSRRIVGVLLALAMSLAVFATPALADPSCNLPTGDGIWRSSSTKNVGASNIQIQRFQAMIEVQRGPADSGANYGAKNYIEIRQSGDSGVVDFGVRYITNATSMYAYPFVFLRNSDNVVKLSQWYSGIPLANGSHVFEISHPDKNHYYFFLDGSQIAYYTLYLSGEFYANQKTVVSGQDSLGVQSPGGYDNGVHVTNFYTQTQYGEVWGWLSSATSEGFPNYNTVTSSDITFWDSRCAW